MDHVSSAASINLNRPPHSNLSPKDLSVPSGRTTARHGKATESRRTITPSVTQIRPPPAQPPTHHRIVETKCSIRQHLRGVRYSQLFGAARYVSCMRAYLCNQWPRPNVRSHPHSTMTGHIVTRGDSNRINPLCPRVAQSPLPKAAWYDHKRLAECFPTKPIDPSSTNPRG